MTTTSAAYLAPHNVPVAETIVNDDGELTIPDGYVRVGEAALLDADGAIVRHGIGHVWLDIRVTDGAAFARIVSTGRPSRLLLVTTRGEGDDIVHHGQLAPNAVIDAGIAPADELVTVTMRGDHERPDPFYREFLAGPGAGRGLAASFARSA